MKKMLGVQLAVAIVLIGANSHAVITGTTGAVVIIDPPESVESGQLESDTEIRLFDEVQNSTLLEEIVVNISSPGTYSSAADLPSPQPVIPSGSVVSSHFFHADNVGGTRYYEGTATFDQEIVGVILRNDELDNSDDVLGATPTSYPTGYSMRETLNFDEYVIVGEDLRTITLSLRVVGGIDQVRVITADSQQACWPDCPPNVEASVYGKVTGKRSKMVNNLGILLIPLAGVIFLRILRGRR
jgi:hypothetical protein